MAAGDLDTTPVGVEANRRNLEAAIGCVYRQRLIPRWFTVDELFDDVTAGWPDAGVAGQSDTAASSFTPRYDGHRGDESGARSAGAHALALCADGRRVIPFGIASMTPTWRVMPVPVSEKGHGRRAPQPEDSSVQYWDEVAEEWRPSPQTLWRAHSDAVNSASCERGFPPCRVARVLW